jgi:hypothetical protein
MASFVLLVMLCVHDAFQTSSTSALKQESSHLDA